MYEMQLNPDNVYERTVDSEGRINLGEDLADHDIIVAILEDKGVNKNRKLNEFQR